MIDFGKLTLEEIKQGYILSKEDNRYICIVCEKEFENGEIFYIDQHYYDANKAVQIHIHKEHDGIFEVLLGLDKKSTTLTETQSELMNMMHDGLSDLMISKKANISASTVRTQRFTFKEKARQAKIFLAIYELCEQAREKQKTEKTKGEDIIDIHGGARMIDERYSITKDEEKKIISTVFTSVEPLKLKLFPVKEKKKIVILNLIAAQFKADKKYTEAEVNAIIKDIYEDYVTIRRYLIEYGYLQRNRDCSEYWV